MPSPWPPSIIGARSWRRRQLKLASRLGGVERLRTQRPQDIIRQVHGGRARTIQPAIFGYRRRTRNELLASRDRAVGELATFSRQTAQEPSGHFLRRPESLGLKQQHSRREPIMTVIDQANKLCGKACENKRMERDARRVSLARDWFTPVLDMRPYPQRLEPEKRLPLANTPRSSFFDWLPSTSRRSRYHDRLRRLRH
ncbi:hypothetical protein CERZMDRAFT_93288 [Cercospora zeae-maydis SCOH1-5]|uniref:Uncharacterized protein n=1 Tax=Cercospora zeae-maydis SCOH1-5 TaxID=717836 RepID=A0A6A6FUT4_9PEZI|nr:hypothetical protein CERZMDRAFT_93288 [Cercospora zeae-maydis SCOH1-5]